MTTANGDPMTTIDIVVMGYLIDELPNGGDGFNGHDYPLPKPIAITELVVKLGLGANAEYFVMLNDEHLPVEKWQERLLQAGDRVVLCPPLKGG